MHTLTVVLCVVAAASALPYDPVIRQLDSDLRHQYVAGPDGELHLVDLWGTVSDVAEAARYNPDRQNIYHLYTRRNPTVSQPMLIGNEGLLALNNYDPARRTIILLHGWLDDATSDFNNVLVPAFLSSEDVNVIVVDWSAGAGTINYVAAVSNTVSSGESVGRFIEWLNSVTGATPAMYHIVGFNLGAHQAGVAGRTVGGEIAYITGLEAAYAGWVLNSNKLRPADAVYTEAIHTNAGLLGYIGTLANADFYPNGGISMPGCNSQECDQARSFFYFAESIQTGGFTGRRCATFITAMAGQCYLWGNLRMGGLVPKTGSSGVYHLETRASPPFSRG